MTTTMRGGSGQSDVEAFIEALTLVREFDQHDDLAFEALETADHLMHQCD